MANPGEWISFEELCVRWPGKSAATLRRYKATKLISYRQAVRGGRIEFNWRTVSRELAGMETPGTSAAVVALAALPPDYPPDLVQQVAEMRALMGAMAQKLGVTVPAMFAGEHSSAEPTACGQRRAG